MNVRKELVQGLRDGFPIGLGYAPAGVYLWIYRGFRGTSPVGGWR